MPNVFPLFPSATRVAPASPHRSVGEQRTPPSPATLPKFMARRNQVFYFKRKIPAALVADFGNQAQIWKSLGTSNFTEAQRQLTREIASFELRVATARLRMARDGLLSNLTVAVKPLRPEMIPALVQRYEVHMLDREEQDIQAMRPLSRESIAERKADTETSLQYYQLARLEGRFCAVGETADQLLDGEGLRSQPGAPFHTALCEALLDAEVRILHEQCGRLEGNRTATPSLPIAIRLQPCLTDYLVTWIDMADRPRKTVETTTRMVRMWDELMGQMPAASITPLMVVRFRDKLTAMSLSASTIRNRLGLLRAVVNTYHVENGLQAVHNPFDKIPVKDNGQRLNIKKDRRAFEMSELCTIYRAPLFVAHQSLKGQPKEAGYWTLLMGPFVGARIEELAQMRLADIEIINGTWTLRICNLDATTQRLKNAGSFRRVPIHDELIKLGFLQYACAQKRAGHSRLFPSLENNNIYRRWSNALGKWFARFLHELGMTSPDLDFHSFRYNFKQRLTQCGVENEVRDALTGHWLSKDAGGKTYMRSANQQYSFPAVCNAIKMLRYAELDLSALYVLKPLQGVDAKLFVE